MIKTTLKRSLSMILALVMVFAMVPASIFPTFAAEGDGWYQDGETSNFYVDNGKITGEQLKAILSAIGCDAFALDDPDVNGVWIEPESTHTYIFEADSGKAYDVIYAGVESSGGGYTKSQSFYIYPVANATGAITDNYANASVGSVAKTSGTNEAPAAPAGATWVGPYRVEDSIADGVECVQGKITHTHNDDCYDKVLGSCSHGAHDNTCYSDEENCSGKTGSIFNLQDCTSHTYHWSEGSVLSTKMYGANTMSCSHVHVAYGQTGSCYTLGELGEGCATRSWRSGNVLEGDFGGWQYYEHSHFEPDCYTYTWALKWNTYTPSVNISGKDGVTATVTSISDDIVKDGKLTHGEDVKLSISAPGESGWTATVVNGSTSKAVSLNVDKATSYTLEDLTSGSITITLARKPVREITLTKYGSGTASVNVESAVEDDIITITATPTNKGENVKYALGSIVVTRKDDDSEISTTSIGDNKYTFTMPDADVSVVVTFTTTTIEKNDSIGNVKFNTKKDVTAQLDALKKAIFDAVVNSGASLPDGIEYTDLDYSYYPWKDVTPDYGDYKDEWHNEAIGLTETKGEETFTIPVVDITIGSYYQAFGARFVSGGVATEKVKLTGKGVWADLYVEAEITLIEGREKSGITYTNPGLYEFANTDDIINKVLESCTFESAGETSAVLKSGTIPTNGNEATLTYTVTVKEDNNYLGNSTDVEITVKAPLVIYNIELAITNNTWGTASLNVDSSISGQTITITATPAINGDNVKYSLDSIRIVYNDNQTIPPVSSGDNKYTFTMPDADVKVTVVFDMENVTFGDGKDTTIEYNKYYADTTAMPADVLNALKQEIFSKLDVKSLPAGATWETVEFYYYQYYDTTNPLAEKGFVKGLKLLGSAADPDQDGMQSGNVFRDIHYNFGERFASGGDATEKVRITYNGMWIETEITLVDSRPFGDITVDNAAIGNITADEESQVDEAAIRAALSNAISADLLAKLGVTIGQINLVANGTPAVERDDGSVSVTLTLPGTADYKDTTKVVSIPVVNPIYNAKIELNASNCEIKVYSNADCTVEVTDLSAVVAGTYYVKVIRVDTGYVAPTPEISEGELARQTNGSYSFTVEAADVAANAKTYTLTATAKKATFAINWVLNGGTVTSWGGPVTLPTSAEYGSEVSIYIDINNPTKAGYTFTGFTSDQVTVVKEDWEGDRDWYTFTMPAEDVTITANYTIKQYTITFDSNGGPAVDSITDYYGEAITLPTPGAWTGYTFLGWFTDEELNNQFVDGTKMPVDGATLYAKWTADASSIAFETNGGSAVPAITGNFGDTATKPADPTKTGYTFAGWYADEALKTSYTFTTLPATPITVYAKWTKNSYTITWELNGGTATSWETPVTNWPTSAEYGSTVSIYIDFNTPKKAGHTFTKFSSNQVEVETVEWEGDRAWYRFTMPAENVTITANYSVNKYTITFVDDDGTTILGSYEVEYGKMPTIPSDPTKDDDMDIDGNVMATYTFAGWDNTVVEVAGDTTYKATYNRTVKTYTITWVVDDEAHYTTVEYGKPAVAPTYTLPDAYHEFVKWDDTPSTVTGDATYTAVLTLTTTSNPTIDKSNYSTENLKDNVLTAVGLPTTGNYTVTTEVGAELPIIGYQTLTFIIHNDKVTVSQRVDYDVAGIFAAALKDDTSRTFIITDNDTGVSKSVNVAVVEDRADTSYTVGKNDFTVNADTVIDETWLNNNLGINVPSGQGYSISVVGTVPTLVAGNIYTVTVKIVIVENSNFKGLTEEFDITIRVNNAFVKITDSENITYNPEMSVEDITKYILENLTVLYNPQALKDMPHSIKYLANEATTVPVTVNLKNLDLGPYASLIPYDTITVDIPVAALWLDIGAEYPETTAPSNKKLESIFNELITKYGVDLALGKIDVETLKSEFKAILDADKDLKLYYQYLAAHKFGAQSNETVKIIVDGGEEYGLVESNTYVIDLTDTRYETEIKVNTGVTVTYGKYTEAELMALILDGVYANGNKIDGLTVELVTDVIGLPASEASEIVVKFAGNKDYKPSTATATIVINKAPVTVDVDNQVVKYGESYNKLPVITNPAGVDTIQFIVGLDVSDVNIDPSEGASVSAIKGILGNVQLLLPEELQSLLEMADGIIGDKLGKNISFADGASMKLSELQAAVDSLDDLFAGSDYEEYFNVLLKMLKSLPTETADIMITIGGELPTNIGVYLIGAVTADQNYETAFGVGVLAIYPDGIKAEIAWNQNDDNYIITNTLLSTGAFDTAAHATSVGAGGTIEEATAQILEIFVGVDIDANITLETDPAKLNVGAYVEIAMIANWGNQMYYSEPIARPIVVIAETLDVDFVDGTGAVNNERHYEFDNTAKNGMEGNLLVTYKNGGAIVDPALYTVKYIYAGVQTNGMPYAGQTAPVHAGVYTITAIVVIRDNTGNITHAGQGIGAFVIEPSKSTITVENEAVKWTGDETTVNQFVDANSVNVPGLKPDTTIISAGISADLDANIGLAAIKGNVNIDMPAWLDNVMNKLGILEAGYADGITADTFISYVEKLEAAMTELGVELDAFREIVNVVEQLPGKTTLTFHDNKGYSEVGVYLIIGIVTDSDHYPSAAAGIMVIYPDATKVELSFNKTWDDNNVFTWKYLEAYDLNATASIEAATAKITNIYVGFTDDGKILLKALPNNGDLKNEADFDNGIYTQVAFILDLSNAPYYAEPISRVFVVVPNPASVDFVDENGNVNNVRHFEFFNVPHAMDKLLVTLSDGTKLWLDSTSEGVDILYTGVQSNGMPYVSNEAPVHAGVYEVTAQYTARDDQNRVVNLGVGIGALVIEPSKSTITVENEAVKWDGNEHNVNQFVDADSVNVPTITPDTTIISAAISADLDANTGLNAIKGNVNIDMPAWLDNVMNKLGILEAGYADGITAETFISYVEKLEAAMTELGVELDAFREIVNVVEQLPGKTTLTFHDNKGYSEVGVYLIIGIVTDSDHYPSAAAGIMVIYPDATKVELSFNKTWDDNNVFTWEYLKTYDLNATASIEAATAKITNIYVGFTDDGKILLKALPNNGDLKNETEFDNGIYTQVSYILDLSNAPYYAEPISRVFVVVPNPAKIEFIDENGNVNNERHFVFNNAPHAMNNVRVTVNGVEILNPDVTITYVGVQTNGVAYNSTNAPVHAGTYVVTATYTARDDQDRLVTLGAAVGAMIIEPAKASIDVDNRAEKYEQGKKHDTSSMVVITTDIANITPDKTVITAMIKTDGTFSENGLKALEGAVNMDLPAWLDAVVAEYDLFTDGLTAAEFIAGVNQVKAKLAELGITTEALDGLVKIAAQLPEDATITFKEQAEIAPEAVGAYLVIGVVTDSDFYPAMDAGLMVIYPAVTETNLSWIYEDVNNNNIYTKDTLEIIDLGAKADADIADLIVNLFIGVDAENWQIAVEFDQTKLSAGIYEEFSFVKPNVDSVIYYAKPINRPVIVVANIYNVNINNVVTEMFDNTAKDIGEITVTTMSGEPVDISNGTLEVVYVGIDTLGRPYYNTEAPVHAGIYTVVVTYVGNDADGDPAVGASIAKLTITPADVEINVGSHAGLYGQDYTFEVTTKHEAINDEPKTLVIIAGIDMSAYSTEGNLGIDGTVNVDFPEVIDNILKDLFPEIYVNGIGTDAFFAKYDEMVAAIEAEGYSADLLKQLKTMLEKLNAANLTFNETAKPTETGLYAVIAMTFDPDYKIAVDTALIAIAADATVADLDFKAAIPGALNILPFELLDEFDFSAYVSALKSTNSSLTVDDIKVKDVIFGLTADFELFLGSSASKPTQMGIYDQIAYASAEENNFMAILPILRFFTVADHSANVVYIDPNGNINWLREFEYDGQPKDMGASIIDADNNVLTATPNLWYIGIEDGCVFYSSSEAPTEVGLYQVIGYYMDSGENIYTVGLGAMRINPNATMLGDVDLDGDVDAYDLTLLARHVANIEHIVDAIALVNADVNCDSVIDAYDLTKHARYVANIITDWTQE